MKCLKKNLCCREAGDGQLEVFLRNDDTKEEVPFKLSDNQDGTYTVDYEAPRSGRHSVTLRYDGVQVSSTPIKFRVQPNVDVSKIRVDGLEPSKYALLYPVYPVCFCHLASLWSRFHNKCSMTSRPRQQPTTI